MLLMTHPRGFHPGTAPEGDAERRYGCPAGSGHHGICRGDPPASGQHQYGRGRPYAAAGSAGIPGCG